MRVPAVIRWKDVIKPGTVFKGIFALYDWLPTFVEIAGGPKGDELNKQIEGGKYKGIARPRSMAYQLSYLQGKTEHARLLLLLPGPHPSAVRFKNWKFYYTMMGATGPESTIGARPTPGLRSTTSRAIRSKILGGRREGRDWVRRCPGRPERGVYL